MNIKSTSPTFPHSFPYQQPQTLQEFIEAYLEHLLVVNYSPQTVESQTNQATALLLQILRTAGDPPTGTGRLAGSQRFSNSHPPLPETRRQAIGRWQATPLTTAVVGFFRWLVRRGFVTSNPAAELEMPRIEHRLPKAILSPSEVERILLVPDVTRPFGLRERAILEVFQLDRRAPGRTVQPQSGRR